MNHLTEFLFPERGVRGAYVDLHEGIEAMLGWREYGPELSHLLGQALAATPLLASHLKFNGRINLQFQGGERIKLLVTQIDSQLQLRGMAQAQGDARGDFQELLEGGRLALMLEPGRGQHYQGIVDVRGESLAQALEGYFEQSEQLQTLLCLGASCERFRGLMLQRLPARSGRDDDGNWNHLRILGSTLDEAELLSVDGETLLRRLFFEETLRVFEPRPVRLACRCTHAGISAMLVSLGEEELRSILQEQGRVEVTCEFCGRVYAYSDAEVRALLSATQSQAEHHTRQ